MRVTNNMIMSNTKININGNKTNVNTLNNKMTSQKKISRPSAVSYTHLTLPTIA